jgi:hypothetical protein
MAKNDFDLAEDLQNAGASQDLSRAIIKVVAEKQVAQLATKSDLFELRAEFVETREVLRSEMAVLGSRLTEKMAAMQNKLVLWLIGTGLGIVALIAGVLQLMK